MQAIPKSGLQVAQLVYSFTTMPYRASCCGHMTRQHNLTLTAQPHLPISSLQTLPSLKSCTYSSIRQGACHWYAGATLPRLVSEQSRGLSYSHLWVELHEHPYKCQVYSSEQPHKCMHMNYAATIPLQLPLAPVAAG
jgi:hypothetical protein